MLECLICPVGEQTVLRAWHEPVRAYIAPAPVEPPRFQLPDGWTVVTSTATGYINAWAGDTPLLPDGSSSCDRITLVKIAARTPAPRFQQIL